MKEGINPIWEDEKELQGGCFSFKVVNKQVVPVWNTLMQLITGETISNNNDFIDKINGITISPKKSFCILKIWMSNVEYQNPKHIVPIDGLAVYGCLFKNINLNTINFMIIYYKINNYKYQLIKPSKITY